MCTTCGCASGNVRIEGEHHHHHDDHHHHEHGHSHSHDAPAQIVHHHHYHGPVHIHYHVNETAGHHHQGHSHSHEHSHGHSHDHDHDHDHHHSHSHEEHHHEHTHQHEEPGNFKPEKEGDDLHFGQGPARSHAPGMTQSRMVQIEQDILAKNDAIAEKNREFLQQRNIKALNMVSSPGSGKTTLLTETLKLLGSDSCSVIEGDQQTTNDADRIRETGAKAIQINTGKGCHLDAQMVSQAIGNLAPEKDSTLFIENVGNLVCPAAFDLGESHKVAILSVTEGEDKPLKYPDIFADADLMIINKIDLLPYLNFDVEACIENAQRVNPNIQPLRLSATTGEGMQAWLDWLGEK
ncbi:hydrogenase nickel incorporation protein HypB [Vibrio sp. JC009]|uniref:hydrogenase nickel incorporation protein HypB n=1 Tax=Vibrio sp. JC009 TaxID=2912314 RepID=UPI0023AF206E|nr:hydrogenase nickel incorporation protein HypB [Vibrio sp. JC009]WED21727.1 hydrogenase nickel incorporation protein HypB [Vibrio sp. JC009]